MILHEIYLKNFRSYKEATISLVPGSTLLSGDIGSGKSSVLFAVEFALFGILKGVSSGDSLLRSGKDSCTVRLTFSIDSKTYIVTRGLRRKGGAIQQTPGKLTADGTTEDLMPEDLKSRILDILGYPRDLLKKSKGFVYRYTVYTPQEEMKQIILEDKEARLDILRKVFGIEKYKLVLSNAAIVARGIREQLRRMEGRTEDLESKKKIAADQHAELRKVEKEIATIEPDHVQASRRFKGSKERMVIIEKECAQLQTLRREDDRLENELRSRVDERTRNIKDLDDLRKKRGEGPIPATIDSKELTQALKEAEIGLKKANDSLMVAAQKIGEYEAICKNAERIKQKIAVIDVCPTCEQEVKSVHKTHIAEREEATLAAMREKIGQMMATRSAGLQTKKEKEIELDSLREKLSDIKAHEQRRNILIDLDARITALDLRNAEIKQRVGEINQQRIAIRNTFELMKDKENEREQLKSEMEAAGSAYHSIDKLLSVKREDASGKQRLLSLLNSEIAEKEQVKQLLVKAKRTLAWIDQRFIPLISGMERQVMRTVYHEFSALFTQWFNVLIEDETLSVRLDEEFSPIVIQNGYEIDVHSLSGGERTSCALAYRLALNKVINDLIDTIKTTDLIILDEPTDGFSTEQLDRMRDLLSMLRIAQVIIVSHETKIESFVEHIIRIDKQHHISQAS